MKRCRGCGKDITYEETVGSYFCSYKCEHEYMNYHHNYYFEKDLK